MCGIKGVDKLYLAFNKSLHKRWSYSNDLALMYHYQHVLSHFVHKVHNTICNYSGHDGVINARPIHIMLEK